MVSMLFLTNSKMDDILVDLHFNFTTSLQSKTKYASKWGISRIRYHRQFELLRNQFVLLSIFLAKTYKKAGWSNPKIGILSPDLFPETNEALAISAMDKLEQLGFERPTMLSRRKDFKKNDLKFTSLMPWNDLEVSLLEI